MTGSSSVFAPAKFARALAFQLLHGITTMGSTNLYALRAAILCIGKINEEDVTKVAIHLSSKFPQSGMTLQIIEKEIRDHLASTADGATVDNVGRWIDREMRQ